MNLDQGYMNQNVMSIVYKIFIYSNIAFLIYANPAAIMLVLAVM